MRRKRLTITLSPQTLSNVDSYIDGRKIRNRSHAIESIIKSYLNSKVNTAVILSGGIKQKKTLFKKLRNETLLDYQLTKFIEAEINNIFILTNINKHHFDVFLNNKKYKDLNIKIVKEKKPLGTAGTLLQIQNIIKNNTFIVIHGDVFTDLDIKDLIDFHNGEKYLSTISLTTVTDPESYGMVKVKGQKIVEFLEKPKKQKDSNLISSGVYVLNPKVFSYIYRNKFQSMELDIFPVLARQELISAYIHSGFWYDISYQKMYKNALNILKKGN